MKTQHAPWFVCLLVLLLVQAPPAGESAARPGQLSRPAPRVASLSIPAQLALTPRADDRPQRLEHTLFAPAITQRFSRAPQLVGRLGGPIETAAISSALALVNMGQHLAVLDVTDPTKPTLLGQTTALPRHSVERQV